MYQSNTSPNLIVTDSKCLCSYLRAFSTFVSGVSSPFGALLCKDAEDVARQALQVSRSPDLKGTALAHSTEVAAALTKTAARVAQAAAYASAGPSSDQLVRAAQFGARAAEASLEAVVEAVMQQGDAAPPSALDLAGKAEIAATYLFTASNVHNPCKPLAQSSPGAFATPTPPPRDFADLGLIDAATLLERERAKNEALKSQMEFLSNRLAEQENKKKPKAGATKPAPASGPSARAKRETRATGTSEGGRKLRRKK